MVQGQGQGQGNVGPNEAGDMGGNEIFNDPYAVPYSCCIF